ncbi:MAG: hypothetical protein R3B98_09880 [Hyphomonas sp.]
MSLSRSILAAAALCSAAACATAPAPPPAPALTFAGTADCSETPDASLAAVVPVKKFQTSGNLTKTIDAEAPCVTVDGSKRPYALFRLPEGVSVESVQAGGLFQRTRVFAPEVVMLDADMAPARTFGPEAYQNRGGSWSTFFRAREGEKYVLVRANPDLIGEGYDFARGQQEPLPDKASRFVVISMPPTHKDYSYEGMVFVRIYLSGPAPIPPKQQ